MKDFSFRKKTQTFCFFKNKIFFLVSCEDQSENKTIKFRKTYTFRKFSLIWFLKYMEWIFFSNVVFNVWIYLFIYLFFWPKNTKSDFFFIFFQKRDPAFVFPSFFFCDFKITLSVKSLNFANFKKPLFRWIQKTCVSQNHSRSTSCWMNRGHVNDLIAGLAAGISGILFFDFDFFSLCMQIEDSKKIWKSFPKVPSKN